MATSPHKDFGLIFDFNGVMVDDYGLQKQAWSHISQILRKRPVTDEEMIHKIRGVPSQDTIVWMSSGKLGESRVNELAEKKSAITKKLFASPTLHLYKGLEAFLESVRKRTIPCTIATSQTAAVFDDLFETLGLERWFQRELVVCYDGQYPGKPAPDACILGAQKLHLAPERCIVFEDALSGVQSAWAAGVHHIIVIAKPESASEFQSLPGVTKVISDFSKLNVDELVELTARQA